jgi:AbrB family looped-hinge helix DNA binding protein
MEATMTSKGQIVIPSSLRRKYGLKGGIRIRLVDDGEQIILKPITPEYVHKLRGMLKGKGGLRALVEDRRMEKER